MTTLQIAHDMKTMKKAKRILFFKNGQLVGDGVHKKLSLINEDYKKHFTKLYL